ncbi:ankyrin repeat protein [Dyadobacter jejuensis]|uniref:Ankyrin repeat protein n=1 Tax=Dyadobacter jejuensis TaxID=1082580 RepID=A0A316ASH1_9BACT|nr:ankyrin repeat domain-containing protein [Dyadobacter jejuensis]PWJ60468.1 ankyrin repeat protein [Dyadobacter jejuensis]
MRKLLFALCTLSWFSVHAQKNLLLEPSFWKGSPDVAAVKAAIEKGSNPAQFNNNSFDPVVLAINSSAPNETIKYLLDQPGNGVDKITHDSRTYLHWAALHGNVEIMEFLIGKGAKDNVVDSHGSTALNFAAGSGQTNTKVYELCLANGADLKKDLNQNGANALLIAVASDEDFKLTNYFISKGLDLKSTDASGANAFSYAARSGNIDLLKKLQAKGIKPNGTAMLMAAQGSRRSVNKLDVYQYLESQGVKPDFIGKNGQNALHTIVRRPGQNDIIEYFLSKGVDVNQADETGTTVFMNAAASNDDLATLNLLLPKVKDINQANAQGVTALMMATKGNSAEAVALLIGKGASIDKADNNGDNLAYYLVQSYNSRSTDAFEAKLKVLQDKGFKVDAQQPNGSSFYHLAVAKNDLELVKLLEPFQIDVNAKDKQGLTALHKAAMVSTDDALLKYLIAKGAKKDAMTGFDETPYDLASENESFAKNKIDINFLK